MGRHRAKLFLLMAAAPKGFSHPSIAAGPSGHLRHGIVSRLRAEPASEHEGFPPRAPRLLGGVRLTFRTHAVVEAFVVEAPVVGHADVPPQVTAGPCQHSKHTWSAKLSGPAPRPAHGPTGQEVHRRCGRAVPGQGGAIWCTRLPAGTTDGCHGRGPCGRVAATQLPSTDN